MNSTMSEEAINKRNEMFREVHPAGPATHEKTFVTVDESVYNGAFTATQGKTLADVQRENEKTVNDLFKPQEEIGSVFEPSGEKLEEKKSLTRDSVKSMVDAGGVFEKQDKLDEQPRFSETPNKRLDNIDWDAFYDESDTMYPEQHHLFRQPTKFEDVKFYYHDTKDTVAEVKGFDQNSLDNNSIKTIGIEPETLDRLKKEIDEKEKAHNNEIKHHDTIKGPSLPSMDFVK